MNDHEKLKVLYVDDEQANLDTFRASFRRTFEVFTAISAEEATKILNENTIHVLLSDQKMPGVQGTQLLEKAVKLYPNQARILITAHANIDALMVAVQKG